MNNYSLQPLVSGFWGSVFSPHAQLFTSQGTVSSGNSLCPSATLVPEDVSPKAARQKNIPLNCFLCTCDFGGKVLNFPPGIQKPLSASRLPVAKTPKETNPSMSVGLELMILKCKRIWYSKCVKIRSAPGNRLKMRLLLTGAFHDLRHCAILCTLFLKCNG